MTKIGQPYSGIWPEHPISNVKEGDVVRYPEAQTAKILRGTVRVVTEDTVLFEEGSWCYIEEVSEDRD